MIFTLHDHPLDGSQVGAPVTSNVPVSEGIFTVELAFGSGPFDGEARWLAVSVMCPGDSEYADLGRQALTAVPYAL